MLGGVRKCWGVMKWGMLTLVRLSGGPRTQVLRTKSMVIFSIVRLVSVKQHFQLNKYVLV